MVRAGIRCAGVRTAGLREGTWWSSGPGQSAMSLVVGAVSAVSVAALALLGVAVVSAGGSPVAAADVGATLKTVKIGGVDVLANADGLTLYWFAPDTSTSSKCFGSCAIYWPPVSGSPAAGPGVTGKLGTIKRPGGGLQATYDGHPLYTYIGDRGPGQANGNDLDLNGGFWYDIRVARAVPLASPAGRSAAARPARPCGSR